MNVLVVIDVQNCFMFHSEGEKNGGTFLNAGEQASKEIVEELDTLVHDKTHVVFSRDFHPVNHISLEGYEGRQIDYKTIWPKHCRNKTLHCKSRIGGEPFVNEPVKNNFVDIESGNMVIHGTEEWNKINTDRITNVSNVRNQYLEVVGTELSYMFFKSSIFREPVRKLIVGNRSGRYKIGLDDTTSESITGNPQVIDKNDEERKINYGESLTVDGDSRKYISLTKGERCDKEAYSAFNYHIQYNPSDPYVASNTPKDNIPPTDAANSTGLWEWILNNRNGANEIIITVCGLVGNVCVMHSLLQGIALWNNVYSKLPENKDVKVKFVYSLYGTRFAPVPPFNDVEPDFDTDNVVGHFNQEGLPDGMGIISMKQGNVTPSERVTSFEVLTYEGKVKDEKGEFAFTEFTGSKSGGRRRSVRRLRSSSRRRTVKKSNKTQKGRRTKSNRRSHHRRK